MFQQIRHSPPRTTCMLLCYSTSAYAISFKWSMYLRSRATVEQLLIIGRTEDEPDYDELLEG